MIARRVAVCAHSIAYVDGVKSLRWLKRPSVASRVRNVCVAAALCGSLASCASSWEIAGLGPGDTVDSVRMADLTARFPPNKPSTNNGGSAQRSSGPTAGGPQIFSGLGSLFGAAEKPAIENGAAASGKPATAATRPASRSISKMPIFRRSRKPFSATFSS